ncbi:MULTISPECIES: hypothetical protein [unclassified Streptomyces]|uniref:hypothetical protein n=1 Tax=unclassified Streptomyces TaxID=2593676 RepID=UPI002E2DECF0|nr:hypothetical protein [Streptomyces sp. NBC_00223]
MRRIATVLGTLAVAAMLSLSVSQSAFAANGDLIINGKPHHNPHGCYNSDRWPLTVQNDTDEEARIYEGRGCQGDPIDFVAPGDHVVSEFGGSVEID